MKLIFNFRNRSVSMFTKSCVFLSAVIFVSMLMCIGSPLDLGTFSPTSFAQFFMWCSAFVIMTVWRAFFILMGIETTPVIDFFNRPEYQMFGIGMLALLSVLIFWGITRYILVKYWDIKNIRFLTTLVKCYTYWGIFQLICVFIAFAWQ